MIYEEIIWFNQRARCERCGTPTFMGVLRDSRFVTLASEATPQRLCTDCLSSKLSVEDGARMGQDVAWLECTALRLRTTRARTKAEMEETTLLVLRMNYTLLWLQHADRREEALVYREVLLYDPQYDQETGLSLACETMRQETTPPDTPVVLDAPASIVHARVRNALLKIFKPGSPLSEDIALVLAEDNPVKQLPEGSCLLKPFL